MTRKEYRAKMRAEYGADWWKKDQKARRARRKTGFAASPKKKKAWHEGWPTINGIKPHASGQNQSSRMIVNYTPKHLHESGWVVEVDAVMGQTISKGEERGKLSVYAWADNPYTGDGYPLAEKHGLSKPQAIATARKFLAMEP